MTAWPDLLASALVGTDRRGGADDAARSLLDEAAAWTVYRRAGTRPVAALPAAEPAPAEALPLVSGAAAVRLALLADPDPFTPGLDSSLRTALLTEWLRTAVERGRRVPPESLPDLFEAARRSVELRALVVAAAGARSTWLIARNPEWTFLVSTVDESAAADPATWQEGTLGQRAGYLASLRRTDPAAARDLLTADWGSLDSGERIQLLDTLAIGLGPDDENLLEAALDDRRREVRLGAAELLARLPGSRLNERMTARARAAVTVRGDTIAVAPPGECDPSMRRDGIEAKPPAGVGARAWWLQQILARVRLDTLADRPPAEWLRLSIEDDWTPVICRGLAVAARDQRDPAWAAAVLDRVDPTARPGQADQALIEALYAVLPTDEIVRRARSVLGTDHPGAARVAGRMLEETPGPWSDELAAVALSTLEAALDAPAGLRGPAELQNLIRAASLRLPANLAPAMASLATRVGAYRPDDRRVYLLERLADLLQFRHEMIQELA